MPTFKMDDTKNNAWLSGAELAVLTLCVYDDLAATMPEIENPRVKGLIDETREKIALNLKHAPQFSSIASHPDATISLLIEVTAQELEVIVAYDMEILTPKNADKKKHLFSECSWTHPKVAKLTTDKLAEVKTKIAEGRSAASRRYTIENSDARRPAVAHERINRQAKEAA